MSINCRQERSSTTDKTTTVSIRICVWSYMRVLFAFYSYILVHEMTSATQLLSTWFNWSQYFCPHWHFLCLSTINYCSCELIYSSIVNCCIKVLFEGWDNWKWAVLGSEQGITWNVYWKSTCAIKRHTRKWGHRMLSIQWGFWKFWAKILLNRIFFFAGKVLFIVWFQKN